MQFKDVLKVALYSRTLPLLISCVLIILMGRFFNLFIPLLHLLLLGYFIFRINLTNNPTEAVPITQQPMVPNLQPAGNIPAQATPST